MNLHLYRYGEARLSAGLSLGVTRHLPRGIRREDYIARGYFDVWLPLLAPSRDLLDAYLKKEISFARFASGYRTEMKQPEPRQIVRFVAALALRRRINLGCFCPDASHCHRSVLRDLVVKTGKELPPDQNRPVGFASPACSMPEIED